MRIEIDDKDALARQVAEALMATIYERYSDTVDDAIQAAVTKMVAEHAETMTVEMLRPAIAAALESDFGTTDHYGNHKPRNLRSLIVDFFTTTRYQSTSEVQRIANDLLTNIMKAEFQPLIDKARAELRTKLDHILGEKVSLAVREAVGLR